MSEGPRWLTVAAELAAAPRLRQALTVVILVVALVPDAVRAALGWPGLVGLLAALLVIAGLSLWGQRGQFEWRGILPVSLLTLFGWIALSVAWSSYTWATVGGIAYTMAWGVLAVYIALSRDLIQMVRAAGEALRAILVASMTLEVMSGLIFDTPYSFVGISGNLAVGGPIQGVAGTRNYLCFLAGLAVITFWIELRTRSVHRLTSVLSLVLAGVTVLLARSPVTFLALLAVGAAGLALMLLRRTTPERRAIAQPVLLIAVGVAVALGWIFRERILRFIDAGSALEVRLELWNTLRQFIAFHSVEGWGWVGRWPTELVPFSLVLTPSGRPAHSALNGFLDAWFQIGLVGAIILVIALGLGFVRAWLVASEFRSTVHVWPALTLALLGTTSVAESYVLTEGGILLAVVACIAAARKRSWRERLH